MEPCLTNALRRRWFRDLRCRSRDLHCPDWDPQATSHMFWHLGVGDRGPTCTRPHMGRAEQMSNIRLQRSCISRSTVPAQQHTLGQPDICADINVLKRLNSTVQLNAIKKPNFVRCLSGHRCFASVRFGSLITVHSARNANAARYLYPRPLSRLLYYLCVTLHMYYKYFRYLTI